MTEEKIELTNEQIAGLILTKKDLLEMSDEDVAKFREELNTPVSPENTTQETHDKEERKPGS